MNTEERRQCIREATRRYRARLAYEERWRGFSFGEICDAVGIIPSPQSSLQPARWRGITIYDAWLDLKKTKKPCPNP